MSFILEWFLPSTVQPFSTRCVKYKDKFYLCSTEAYYLEIMYCSKDYRAKNMKISKNS